MDFTRGVVFSLLALINLGFLINAKAIARRRFGSNFSVLYGKRDKVHFPGFGKRPYDYGTGSDQGHVNSKAASSETELETPHWQAKPVPLPDWNEYRSRNKDVSFQRNLEPSKTYGESFDGYAPINDYSTDNQGRSFLREREGNYYPEQEGRSLSRENADTYTNIQDGYADEIPGVNERQNQADSQQQMLSQMLKKLLSQTDDDSNSYATWQ